MRFKDNYWFLSNFYPVKISYGALVYPSVENAYQAAKTVDTKKRIEISKMTAAAAKRVGRGLTLRHGWDDLKIPLMLNLLHAKFAFWELRILLLQTDDIQIVEDNYWGDTYWGVCNGVGENNLGKLLMQVRKEISHGI